MVHSFVTKLIMHWKITVWLNLQQQWPLAKGINRLIQCCFNCSGFSLQFLVNVILCRSFQPVVMPKIHLAVAQIWGSFLFSVVLILIFWASSRSQSHEFFFCFHIDILENSTRSVRSAFGQRPEKVCLLSFSPAYSNVIESTVMVIFALLFLFMAWLHIIGFNWSNI